MSTSTVKAGNGKRKREATITTKKSAKPKKEEVKSVVEVEEEEEMSDSEEEIEEEKEDDISDLEEDDGAPIEEGTEMPVDAALAKKLKNRRKKEEKRALRNAPYVEEVSPTVVYLGHIPYGFFEKQLRTFFSQFGKVGKLRLSRSRKTANSKGYAFIEFLNKEVADIVADTMNGYLMFGRILKCSVVEPEKVHPEVFKGAGEKFHKINHVALFAVKHNKPKSEKEVRQKSHRLQKLELKKRAALKAAGIDYVFPGYSNVPVTLPEVPTPTTTPTTTTTTTKTKAKTTAKAKATPKTKATPKKTGAAKTKTTTSETPAKATVGVKKTPAASAKKAAKSKTPAKTPAKKTAAVVEAATDKTPVKAKTPSAKKTKAKTPGKTPKKAKTTK